jgi:nitrous oxidase accessory protein NosD
VPAVGPIIDRYRARGFELVDLATMLGTGRAEPPDGCRVRDRDTGIVSRTLQAAVDRARGGARLVVRGTCAGSTTIDRDLRIRGSRRDGSGPATLQGGPGGPVVTIAAGARVTLAALRIRRGSGSAAGGGLRNEGSLVLREVLVRGNQAADGGGVYNAAGATLRLGRGTILRANRADGSGGGVYNATGASLTMSERAGISRNVAGVGGGGLHDAGGTLSGVVCGAGGNVRVNTPDDCEP